jgi:hypothetical protein
MFEYVHLINLFSIFVQPIYNALVGLRTTSKYTHKCTFFTQKIIFLKSHVFKDIYFFFVASFFACFRGVYLNNIQNTQILILTSEQIICDFQ